MSPRYQQTKRSRRPLIFYALPAVVLAVLGIGLGVGLGVGLSHHHSSSTGQTAGNINAAAGDPTSSVAAASPSASASPLPALPKWDWTKNKMQGMSIGNWLILERWMSESWFVDLAGPDAWDEWSFTEALGTNVSQTLQDHWQTWFNETDVETIYQAGFNHLRIPVALIKNHSPFWALIPTAGDEPYYAGNQLDYVQQAMGWAYKRNMYIEFDLHALPGNQNGEQQSGRNCSGIQYCINFYNNTNQARADQTLQAALTFIQNSNYSSVISAVGVVNEPRPFDSATNLEALQGYYNRSYVTLSAANMPMIWHPAYVSNPLQYWYPTMAGKNPSLFVMEDHPYPGDFPIQSDPTNIMQQVCTDANQYQNYPIPVVVTEWSLTSGLTSASWLSSFYNAQIAAWSFAAGSAFWAYKVEPQEILTQNVTVVELYDWLGMWQNQTITGNATSLALNGSSQCGSAPSRTFTNPVPSST